jgi:4-hydroxybenzoate polyprenyltransferase
MNTRAYLQLVRLPNVFTALADILLAALAAQALPQHLPAFVLLALASACLYSGGMVWNDFFDLEQDRHERPYRPLPSGRVTRRDAALLGAALLAGGVIFAALSGLTHGGFRAAPLLLAAALVGAILLYDGWLKRTWAGPVGMGLCRFLNVLLGLTVAGGLEASWRLPLALVVGLYIAGVTWFARTEARLSSQAALAGAAVVMLASLVLALPLPALLAASPGGARPTSPLFPYLLVALGFLVGIPVGRAIMGPTPPHVQAAVKRALQGLVILDAVLAMALAGSVGLVILLLLVPILYLGRWRWLYAT